MVIGITLFIVAVLIVGIWVTIELKRFKHKLFAIFLILLVLFAYVTATVSLKENEIDFKTIPGLIEAGRLYFSFLGSIFGNLKTITTNAISMNWGINETG